MCRAIPNTCKGRLQHEQLGGLERLRAPASSQPSRFSKALTALKRVFVPALIARFVAKRKKEGEVHQRC